MLIDPFRQRFSIGGELREILFDLLVWCTRHALPCGQRIFTDGEKVERRRQPVFPRHPHPYGIGGFPRYEAINASKDVLAV